MNLRQLLVTVDVLERRNAQLEGLHAVAASAQEEATRLQERSSVLETDNAALLARLDKEARRAPARRARACTAVIKCNESGGSINRVHRCHTGQPWRVKSGWQTQTRGNSLSVHPPSSEFFGARNVFHALT